MGLFDFLRGKKNPQQSQGAAPAAKRNIKGISRTVQDILDFEGIMPDGVIVKHGIGAKKAYSRLYYLVDANFIAQEEEDREEMVRQYSKFLVRFPDNVDVNIVFVNRRQTKKQLGDSFHFELTGDEMDEYRTDYNGIIDKKIEDGNTHIKKEKYIMLTVMTDNIEDATTTLARCEVDMQEAIKRINHNKGVIPLRSAERVRLMHEIMNGVDGVPFELEFGRFINGNELNRQELLKSGVSVKDLIASPAVSREKLSLQLDEGRYCRSYQICSLPQHLDVNFLTRATDLPYEMVTVIQLRTIPRSSALRIVKTTNTNIKSDVFKQVKGLAQSGLGQDMMNEDLKYNAEQAAALREKIVNENLRLFYMTMTVTLFGKTLEEVDELAARYKATCADFSITPQPLLGQQVQGLNSAMLTGDTKLCSERTLTSENACAFYPFYMQELTQKRGHFYGVNAITKNMIIYDRKRSPLANGLIFGQSGSGKSFYTKGEVILNLLDGDDDMIILDPENEYELIAKAFGGTVVDLKPSTKYHLNPFDFNLEWDDDEGDINSHLIEKINYILGLVQSIYGKTRLLTQVQKNAIIAACRRAYKPYIDEMTKRREEGDPNCYIDYSICPTFDNLYMELQREPRPEYKPAASDVSVYIEEFARGSWKPLFGERTNIDDNVRLLVYKIRDLPDAVKDVGMRICLSAIWNRICRNADNNKKLRINKSIWVYIDEFHLFFPEGSSADGISETLKAYYKRVRKYSGIMTGMTQDVDDLLRNPHGTAIFNNTGFLVFLKQSPLGVKRLEQLYKLPDSMLEYVKTGQSGIGLLYNGQVMIPMNYDLRAAKNSKLFELMSTNPEDAAEKERERKRRERADSDEVTRQAQAAQF